ncbi:hypothetical protein CRE_17614 [Caenorhabditis remanei]|uniref:Ras modification protein ERF4 n=1 Tax=Caenorhabditis remanei TaxID=31234 RepID=E3NHB1_CAERE|nr:hypothetical protein CRE_17614 [Caenorhabditis remanei]
MITLQTIFETLLGYFTYYASYLVAKSTHRLKLDELQEFLDRKNREINHNVGFHIRNLMERGLRVFYFEFIRRPRVFGRHYQQRVKNGTRKRHIAKTETSTKTIGTLTLYGMVDCDKLFSKKCEALEMESRNLAEDFKNGVQCLQTELMDASKKGVEAAKQRHKMFDESL